MVLQLYHVLKKSILINDKLSWSSSPYDSKAIIIVKLFIVGYKDDRLFIHNFNRTLNSLEDIDYMYRSETTSQFDFNPTIQFEFPMIA